MPLPNLDKTFICLKHDGIWPAEHVASYERDAIAVLIVTVCVRSLLVPTAALIDESVPANRKTEANIVPILWRSVFFSGIVSNLSILSNLHSLGHPCANLASLSCEQCTPSLWSMCLQRPLRPPSDE